MFYKKNSYSAPSLVLWCVAWIAAGVLLAFAQEMSSLTKSLGFGRTTDLFTAVALAFFAVILFVNYAAVKRSERKVEDLVRQLAIKDVKKKR